MSMMPMPSSIPPQHRQLVSIGRVWANAESLVTPVGTYDLRDVTVVAYDQTRVERFIPGWAIVLAVIGFFFAFLGLLFLLVRETRVSGHVVAQFGSARGTFHAEHIAVHSAADRDDQFGRVSFLQTLIGGARARG